MHFESDKKDKNNAITQKVGMQEQDRRDHTRSHACYGQKQARERKWHQSKTFSQVNLYSSMT